MTLSITTFYHYNKTAILMSVILLSVVILNVIILSVVAPFYNKEKIYDKKYKSYTSNLWTNLS